MAKCLKCNAVIPDGQEYCSECIENENKELYPDGLLNSDELADAMAELTTAEDFEQDLSKDASKYDIMSVQGNSEAEFDQMFQEDMKESDLGELPDLGELFALEDLPEPESEMAAAEDLPEQDIMAIPDFPELSGEPELEAMPDLDILAMTEDMSEESEVPMPEGMSEGNDMSDMFGAGEMPMPEDMPEDNGMAEPEEAVGLDALNDIGVFAQEESPEEDITKTEEGYAEVETSAGAESDMDDTDILDLINSINSSEFGESAGMQEAADEDILALDHFGEEEEMAADGAPASIEDIFSDTLRAVDTLADDENAQQPEGKASGKKAKKDKANKKPGIFKRIFGNVKTERSEEEIAKMKEKIIADAEAEERAEEEKKQKAAQAKEEKKQKAAQDKADAKQKKLEKEKLKAEKKAEKERLKKDAKERKKQEIQNLIDEVENDEGRINRIGATIVFVFFAVLAAAVLIGTKLYSYDVNMERAQEDFGNQRYADAYERVYGIDVREEDEDFYLQVMTVMYTYKQLDSYENYYAMGQYPQALDSLLKGLQRYDKYSALASTLGIEKDMKFVRDQIIEELADVFKLSELEAVKISAIKDQAEYTDKVYEIAVRATEY